MSDIDSSPFPTFLISSNNDDNSNNNNNIINDHNSTSNSLSNPQNPTFANLNNILDLPKFMSLNNHHYVKELELGLEEEEEEEEDHQHHDFADHDILSSMSEIETPNWLRDEPMWLRDHEILLNCKSTMVDRHGSNGLSMRFPFSFVLVGDFVKTHNLQEGDFLMLYKDDQARIGRTGIVRYQGGIRRKRVHKSRQ